MFLSESAAYPAVASIAQNAYDRLAEGEEIDYRVPSDLIGEASGKGALRELNRRYSPEAYEAAGALTLASANCSHDLQIVKC